MRNSSFLKAHVAFVVLALLLLIMVGCGGTSSSSPEPPPPIGPVVVSSTPANNATGVPTNYSVAVTFDQAMNASTLTASSFNIDGVTGTVTYDATNKSAVFHPAAELAASTSYRVNVTTGAKSAAGVALSQTYSFTFTTASLPDVSPPFIVTTSPANGATGVHLNVAVTATFNESMDPTGLVGQTGNGVSASLVYDSGTKTATLTPGTRLQPNSIYMAVIKGTVKDLAGNAMGADYIWTFQTGAE